VNNNAEYFGDTKRPIVEFAVDDARKVKVLNAHKFKGTISAETQKKKLGSFQFFRGFHKLEKEKRRKERRQEQKRKRDEPNQEEAEEAPTKKTKKRDNK